MGTFRVTEIHPYKTNKPGEGSGSKPTHKPGGDLAADLVEDRDQDQYHFLFKFKRLIMN